MERSRSSAVFPNRRGSESSSAPPVPRLRVRKGAGGGEHPSLVGRGARVPPPGTAMEAAVRNPPFPSQPTSFRAAMTCGEPILVLTTPTPRLQMKLHRVVAADGNRHVTHPEVPGCSRPRRSPGKNRTFRHPRQGRAACRNPRPWKRRRRSTRRHARPPGPADH